MKVKFITLGCKVNQYETQALKEKFSSSGHDVVDSRADLYVVNTCSVTAKADSDSRRIIIKSKKENPAAKIAVIGCWAQLNRDAIGKLGVDYIVEQERKHDLLNIVNNVKTRQDMWSLEINEFPNHRAFVKVQDGCDNFCSFCKVPHLRGRSLSRGKESVIEEIKRISKKHKEIVLCGINLGLYGRDLASKSCLYDLLAEILRIDSLTRLRLSSLEPYFIDDRISEMFKNPKMCPHLHLPFQSGDDLVLKEMNKKENSHMYEKIVGKLRSANPDIAISCDIIVGFPAEEEENFNNTVDFLKIIRPMRTHIFTFSARENTKFYGKKINHKIVRERYNKLKELSQVFTLEYKLKFKGKRLKMIVEEYKQGFSVGYTENYIKVMLKDKFSPGSMVEVKVDSINKDNVFVSQAK